MIWKSTNHPLLGMAITTEFAPSFERRVDVRDRALLETIGYAPFFANAREIGATCVQFCALKGSFGPSNQYAPITVRFLDRENNLVKHRTLRAILRQFAPQFYAKF